MSRRNRPDVITILGGASILIPKDRVLRGCPEALGELEARFATARHEEVMSFFWRGLPTKDLRWPRETLR